MPKKEGEERLLGSLVRLNIQASSDFPSIEFHAAFKLGNGSDNTSIALPSINTEFVLGFLNSMGFINNNPNYNKKFYRFHQDFLLLGYDETIKLNRRYYKLEGKLCWLIRESCLYQPHRIEPLNPEDGKPFDIAKWKKKEW